MEAYSLVVRITGSYPWRVHTVGVFLKVPLQIAVFYNECGLGFFQLLSTDVMDVVLVFKDLLF